MNKKSLGWLKMIFIKAESRTQKITKFNVLLNFLISWKNQGPFNNFLKDNKTKSSLKTRKIIKMKTQEPIIYKEVKHEDFVNFLKKRQEDLL